MFERLNIFNKLFTEETKHTYMSNIYVSPNNKSNILQIADDTNTHEEILKKIKDEFVLKEKMEGQFIASIYNGDLEKLKEAIKLANIDINSEIVLPDNNKTKSTILIESVI